MSSGKDVSDAVKSYQKKFDPGQQPDGADRWSKFSGQYFTDDERDTIYQIKKYLSRNQGRTWDVTDEEAKYYYNKIKDFQLLNFHSFLTKTYDVSPANPPMMEWAKKTFPKFFEMRKEMINRQAEAQKRLALIRHLGPETQEDHELMYGISQGVVNIPRGPLWDPQPSEKPKRGLFNPNNTLAGWVPGEFRRNPVDYLTDQATKTLYREVYPNRDLYTGNAAYDPVPVAWLYEAPPAEAQPQAQAQQPRA